MAHRTGVLATMDLERVVVDTTVQPKNVTFTKSIRREMKRRAAVEPVIGHVKAEHRMERNYLKGRDDERANAVLAAGYNFSLLIRWFENLLRTLITTLLGNPKATHAA